MSDRDKWIDRARRAAEILRTTADTLDGVDDASTFGAAMMSLQALGSIGSEIDEEIVEHGGPAGPIEG